MSSCVLPHVPTHLEDVQIDSLTPTPSNAPEHHQGRDHKAKLNSLRESPSQDWPTIYLMQTEGGWYSLLDGYHRLIVARERSESTIRAHVHRAATLPTPQG